MSPAPRLDTDRIERAALELVDEHGLDGLTMRALGERLGVDATAVYRHFRNKDELLESLVDRVFTETSMADVDRADGADDPDWRDVLRRACSAIRGSLLAHPALVPLAILRPPRAGRTLAGIELLLGVLRQAGFGDRDSARAYQAVLYYTLGYTALEAPYAQMEPDEAAAEISAILGFYLAQPAERFPNTAAVAAHLHASDDQFVYGLERLLDGLTVSLHDPPSDPSDRRRS